MAAATSGQWDVLLFWLDGDSGIAGNDWVPIPPEYDFVYTPLGWSLFHAENDI